MHFEESFFEGEERDGFYIEPMMKKAWAAHLEVLQAIDKICTKYNITYYADWGTLLGAVRHKGYIPWDDDIDISMRRVDFMRFLEVAEREFAGELELVTAEKDPTWEGYHARVVNTRKIPLEQSRLEKYHGCPFSAGVDIFIIDNVPLDASEEEVFKILLQSAYCMALAWDEGDMAENMETLSMLEEYCNVRFTKDKPYKQQLWVLADRLASMYRDLGREVKEVSEMHCFIKTVNLRIPVSCYESVIRVPFENTTIPVPCGYDTILKKYYGNYMAPRQGRSTHDYPFYKGQREEFYAASEKQGVVVSQKVRELLGE